MTRYKGGEDVKRGIYVNRGTGEVINFMAEGGVLPEAGGAEYVRVPAIAMLLFGPLVGLVYVMFLPFAAFAMLVWYGINRLIHALSPVYERLMKVVAPGYSPAEAFLHKKGKAPSKEAEKEGKNRS